MNAGKVLDIRRVPNINNSEVGYFIINTDFENLAVNEHAVGSNLIAGPLPDFAVITLGHAALFWWRTHAAIHYSPSPRVRFCLLQFLGSELIIVARESNERLAKNCHLSCLLAN